MDVDLNELIQYRLRNFAVKIEDTHGGSLYPKGEEMCLSITQNGFQWQSIALTKDEARQVIKKLEEWLNDSQTGE